MIGVKNCGIQITEEDFAALAQEERKRIAELVKKWRRVDRLTPEKDLRERAYHMVLAELVRFDE